MHEHHRMLSALLGRPSARRTITCSNPNVWASLLRADDRAMLFLINLLVAPMEAEVRCVTGEGTGERKDPGRLTVAPMTVEAIPLS